MSIDMDNEVLIGRDVAQAAVIGACVGMVLFVLVIGGIGLWVGLDPVAALALGAFTGIWGGLGFGGMIGGVAAVNRRTDQD